MNIKGPNLLHDLVTLRRLNDVQIEEAAKQSTTASNPSTGKQSQVGVVGACMRYIESIDNRSCFLRNIDFTESVEMCQHSIYTDVSQTGHDKMQMKPTDYNA